MLANSPTSPSPPVEVAEAGVQYEEITHSDTAQERRQKLGFMKEKELKQRAAETLISGVYLARNNEVRKAGAETVAAQTEGPSTFNVACGEGEHPCFPSRSYRLQLALPTPQDFPTLTIAQLLEAEKRVKSLLSRLDREISRARAEEERYAEYAASLIEDKKRKEDAQKSRYAMTTDEWNKQMSQHVKERLKRRHHDPQAILPPTFWQQKKLDLFSSPVQLRAQHSPDSTRPQGLSAREKYGSISFFSSPPSSGTQWNNRFSDSSSAASPSGTPFVLSTSSPSVAQPSLGIPGTGTPAASPVEQTEKKRSKEKGREIGKREKKKR